MAQEGFWESVWPGQGATVLSHRRRGSPGPAQLTAGLCGPLPQRPPVPPLLGDQRGVGHGKAGRLGSHRPVAESPGGHLAPISLGRQGAPGAGPVAGWGQGGGGRLCGMTQARDNSLHVFGECKQEGEGAEEVKEGKIVAGQRGVCGGCEGGAPRAAHPSPAWVLGETWEPCSQAWGWGSLQLREIKAETRGTQTAHGWERTGNHRQKSTGPGDGDTAASRSCARQRAPWTPPEWSETYTGPAASARPQSSGGLSYWARGRETVTWEEGEGQGRRTKGGGAEAGAE